MSDRPCSICGAALAPGQVIDRGCAARTRTYLREVPAALAELDLAISRQTSMPIARGDAGCPEGCRHGDDDPACVAGVRLELDQRASDARTALVHAVMGWARVYVEELPERTPVLGPRCFRGTRWLCRHASCLAAGLYRLRSDAEDMLGTTAGQAGLLASRDIVGRSWAAELARDVAAAVEEAWAAVDRPPDTRIVGRCPACAVALYAPEGSVAVRCHTCGGTWPCTDVREASLAESHHLLPVVQLAQTIGVNEKTARSWIARAQLVRARYGMDGKPLYRVSDAAALKARGLVEEESA